MISCEDMVRSFQYFLEEESVEKFLWGLNSSHQVTRFPQAGEERCESVSIGVPILFRDDFSSSDDYCISFSP